LPVRLRLKLGNIQHNLTQLDYVEHQHTSIRTYVQLVHRTGSKMYGKVELN